MSLQPVCYDRYMDIYPPCGVTSSHYIIILHHDDIMDVKALKCVSHFRMTNQMKIVIQTLSWRTKSPVKIQSPLQGPMAPPKRAIHQGRRTPQMGTWDWVTTSQLSEASMTHRRSKFEKEMYVMNINELCIIVYTVIFMYLSIAKQYFRSFFFLTLTV